MLTPFQARASNFLAGSFFFGQLAEDDMKWLLRISVRKGEMLFEKGEASDSVFGLVRGGIKLFTGGSGDREVSFGLVAPGEFIGDTGALSGAPLLNNAVALAHCELATLKRRDLECILERRPELRTTLEEAASEASRRLVQRIEDSAFLSIEARVEKALSDLAERFGERVEGRGTRIQLRQQDLADAVGLSRESVSKVLTSPAMRGRVELGRGRIILIGA